MRSDKAWKAVRAAAVIVTIYLLAVLASRTYTRMTMPHPHPIFGPGTNLNIAHQGGNLERPDETAESFRHGLEAGADVLEMDLHLSADGHLIVIHDPLVNRTTDGVGAVADMTLEELKILDAGYWWPHHSIEGMDERHYLESSEFPWRGKGLELLTFEEVLQSYASTPLVVEIKAGGSAAAMAASELLTDYGRLDDVLVVSSVTDILSAYRELAPDRPTGADRAEVIRFWVLSKFGLAGFSGVEATALQVPVRQGRLKIITRRFIRRAHRHGLAVHAWTINDEQEMKWLMDLGVDGIITDLPTVLAGL